MQVSYLRSLRKINGSFSKSNIHFLRNRSLYCDRVRALKAFLAIFFFSMHPLQALEIADLVEMESLFYESLKDLCIQGNVQVKKPEKFLSVEKPSDSAIIHMGPPQSEWSYKLWVDYPKYAFNLGDVDYVEFGGYGFAGSYEPDLQQVNIIKGQTDSAFSDFVKDNDDFFGGHSFSAYLGDLDAIEISKSENDFYLTRMTEAVRVVVELESSIPFRIRKVTHLNFNRNITTEFQFVYAMEVVNFSPFALIPSEVTVQLRNADNVIVVDKRTTFKRADCETIRDPIISAGLYKVSDYRVDPPVHYKSYKVIPSMEILSHLASDEVFRKAFSELAVSESQKESN